MFFRPLVLGFWLGGRRGVGWWQGLGVFDTLRVWGLEVLGVLGLRAHGLYFRLQGCLGFRV